ncbi:hypothetical protein ACOMHN_009320 [Nucella lapillus]
MRQGLQTVEPNDGHKQETESQNGACNCKVMNKHSGHSQRHGGRGHRGGNNGGRGFNHRGGYMGGERSGAYGGNNNQSCMRCVSRRISQSDNSKFFSG